LGFLCYKRVKASTGLAAAVLNLDKPKLLR
jgi:hypothetical protein